MMNQITLESIAKLAPAAQVVLIEAVVSGKAVFGALPEAGLEDSLTRNFRLVATNLMPRWEVIKADKNGDVYAYSTHPQKHDEECEWNDINGENGESYHIGKLAVGFDWVAWEIRR